MNRGIVLFGHGSRDPAWRRPMDAVAQAIRERDAGVQVVCSFLEFQAPDLPTAVKELAEAGVQSVRIVPMFLGVGTHARNDLPTLVAAAQAACPSLAIDVAPAVGERDEVIALVADLALKEEFISNSSNNGFFAQKNSE